MRSIIFQSVVLPASPEILFNMYLDSVDHAAFTGAPVEIGPEPGDHFSAFGGSLSGTMLKSVPNILIIQSWRSDHFGENDADSTLVLSFSAEGNQGRINLVHLDVPECDYKGVTEGWETYHWIPWRIQLTAER